MLLMLLPSLPLPLLSLSQPVPHPPHLKAKNITLPLLLLRRADCGGSDSKGVGMAENDTSEPDGAGCSTVDGVLVNVGEEGMVIGCLCLVLVFQQKQSARIAV